MAPSAKSVSLLFILTLSFFVQIHARESQFFSKVTNENNDAKETTTVDPNKEEFLTKHEQQPVFIPQTQNGYGLYGHESGQFPPSTTTTIPTPTTTIPTPTTTTSLTNVNAAPYTTTPTTTNNDNAPFKTVFEDDESLNKYLNSNQNYNYNPNPNNNNNNQNNEFYYNNNAYHASQNGLRDSRLTQRGGYTTLANQNNYNNNNNGANSYNNAERQGMSDTRFMENGKYYYDLNLENNYNPNRYENSRGVDSRNWNRQYNNYNNNNNNNRGYYGSNNNENTFEYNNSKEGYQNEEEFQESQDEFVP